MHNLFVVYFVNLYMFRAYLGPSSGGNPYVYNNWYLLISLDDCSNPTRTINSHLKRINTNCCIRTVYLLMMEVDTPETCRGWRNILRISCASSWFLCTRLYRDARSTKHGKKFKLVYLKENRKFIFYTCVWKINKFCYLISFLTYCVQVRVLQ